MRSFTLLWAGILGTRLANLKGRAEPKKRIMVSFWILIKKIGTSQIARIQPFLDFFIDYGYNCAISHVNLSN